jgi:hypothetical protein
VKWSFSFGGTPDYVPPPPSGGPAGLPSIRADIGCPAFDSTGPSTADGPTVALLAPVGATRYRVWFSPTLVLSEAAERNAIPSGVDGAVMGAVTDGEAQITPTWIRLAPYPVSAGSVRATMLVTFE